VDSLTKIIVNPPQSVKIDKSLVSSDEKRRGEAKLKQMLQEENGQIVTAETLIQLFNKKKVYKD
jgi:predicted component of viral defense system (DUF524 family)